MTEGFSGDPSTLAAERRGGERRVVQGIAIVRSRRGATLAEAVDISDEGVCLTLSHPLDVGAKYLLDLELRGQPARSTSIVARVCFCLASNGGYRVGLNCSLASFIEPEGS
jgi:PilZ domain